jgi:hypothetical protein
VITRTARILPIVAVCLAAWLPAPAGAATVADIVNQVNQASFTDYLNNLLYAHNGDNRFLTGPQHDPCADNIFVQFRRFGWTTRFDPFDGKSEGISGPGRNVIAIKQGVTRPDDIYIVGGHYDGKRLNSSSVAPGADDNASGVAGVLEAARVLAPYSFQATIILVAFDNEEGTSSGSNPDHHGGSKHMAADYAGTAIKGMISLDMIAWNDPSNLNKAYCYAASPQSDATRNSLQTAVNTYGSGLIWHNVGTSYDDSDHYPFQLQGYSAVYFCEDDANPYWHNVRDSVDTPGYLDYAYGTKFVRVIVGWLATNAQLVQ